jgi:transposase
LQDQYQLTLEVVEKEPQPKGFQPLLRRRVIERSFAWANRFRRLARDDERLPETVKGWRCLALPFSLLDASMTSWLSVHHTR